MTMDRCSCFVGDAGISPDLAAAEGPVEGGNRPVAKSPALG